MKKISCGLELLMAKTKNGAVRSFCEELKINLRRRATNVESNPILRLAMLLDPRFAFDEAYMNKYDWDDLEEELILFNLRSKFKSIS
jgi:hypothetical protein